MDAPAALAVLAPLAEAPEDCKKCGKDTMLPVVVQKGGSTTATFMPGALFQLSLLGQVLPKGPPPRVVDISGVANLVQVQVCLHEQWCDVAFHHVFEEQFALIKNDRSVRKRVKGDNRTKEERIRGPEMQEANKKLAEI